VEHPGAFRTRRLDRVLDGHQYTVLTSISLEEAVEMAE
jgi:hypothetical protein